MKTSNSGLSRRGFLRGTAIAAAGAAAMGLTGCSGNTSSSTDASSSLGDIVWENEADVVILGTGAAGLSAAGTLGIEGLGSCLILESSTEALCGGGSRVSGQGVFAAEDPDSAVAYLNDLNLPYAVDQDLARAWAEEIYRNNTILDEHYGADMQVSGGAAFPNFTGSDAIRQYNHEGKSGDQGVWKLLKEKVDELEIPIYFETRGVSLITSDEGEVVGVEAEDGRCFKGRKGVILACGGFECNPEMMDNNRPIGSAHTVSRGTWTNVGDGIAMTQRLGAALWHMNSFSGANWTIKIVAANDNNAVAPVQIPDTHDFIFIGSDGNRFVYEESTVDGHGHGKRFRAGAWMEADLPSPAFMIFSQAIFEAKNIFRSSCYAIRNEGVANLQSNQELLDAKIIVQCDTVAQIASFTELNEARIQSTIDRYNAYVATGIDHDYLRGQALSGECLPASLGDHPNSGLETEIMLEAFTLDAIEPPYYVVELIPAVLNTFGGPKRSTTGEVMHVDGQAIPRLFSAGELGAIYTNKYNGGAAFGEAISSGRIAAHGVGSLSAWDAEKK